MAKKKKESFFSQLKNQIIAAVGVILTALGTMFIDEVKSFIGIGDDESNPQTEVVQENNHPLLFKQELSVSNINWLKQPSTNKVSAKIRYRQKDQDCEIDHQGNKAKVFFKEPQRAVTPGQFIVFYEDEICLGGGEIDI